MSIALLCTISVLLHSAKPPKKKGKWMWVDDDLLANNEIWKKAVDVVGLNQTKYFFVDSFIALS